MVICCCLCFPKFTTVITKRNGAKNVDELQRNDEVLTFSKIGRRKWTTFYTYGHREPQRVAEFVVLKVSNGKTLEISKDHLLYIVGPTGRVVKKAGDVIAGDKLYYNGGNDKLELLPITEISLEQYTGVYAPFTMNGDFFANGFLVTCYANVSTFAVGHAAVAPLRVWYRLRRNSSQNQKNLEGIHIYAKRLMKLRTKLPKLMQRFVG